MILCKKFTAINIIIGCCSRHKYYWQDRHTGNRWLVSIWSATPHNQPPLDFTELQDVSSFQTPQVKFTVYLIVLCNKHISVFCSFFTFLDMTIYILLLQMYKTFFVPLLLQMFKMSI